MSSLKKSFLLMIIMGALLLSSVLPTYGAQIDNNMMPQDYGPIIFNTEEIDRLPSEVQKYLKEQEGELVASVATIHVFEKVNDEIKIISSIDYNFSKSEDIYSYCNDISKLKENNISKTNKFGLVEPLSDYHGIITTGINVSSITGTNNNNHYQLHGYWDWHESWPVNSYDRVGVAWSNEFSSLENTHHAYAVRYYDGSMFNLTKLPYNNYKFFNKGVLWRHGTAYRSQGATLAQIFDNSIQGQFIYVNFEYVNVNGPTSDDVWYVKLMQQIFDYLVGGQPSKTHFTSGTSVWVPFW